MPEPTLSGGDGVSSAEWVYVVNEQESDHGLFAVRPDGDDQRKLTDFDAYPVLSPTGSRIAFLVRGADGGAALFVADVDGTNQQELADLVDDVGPVWSPDETRLAFIDYREDRPLAPRSHLRLTAQPDKPPTPRPERRSPPLAATGTE